jgi:nucleolar protein 53
MSEAAPAQYKQKSRKGKKAWRKNVDVTEVAAGLDEVRDQIITGYALPYNYLHNTVLLVF